jgi:hypothetical protein
MAGIDEPRKVKKSERAFFVAKSGVEKKIDRPIESVEGPLEGGNSE